MSSKASRFNPLARANAAVQSEPVPVSSSVLESDAGVFGKLRQAEYERGAAKKVHIFTIAPDPTQPRRVVPRAVQIEAAPDSPTHTLEVWLMLCEADTGWLRPLLDGQEIEFPDTLHPIESALLGVAQLALSIRQQDLVNPISLIEHDKRFTIETGERRWWAFHLLHYLYSDDSGHSQWESIPARIVPQFDRFRQAVENTQRGDLTLIARARQYALLFMALHEEQGATFQSYDDFDTDRAYYAQALQFGRAPDGTGARLTNAMGVSQGMLTRFRKALELSDSEWHQADDENWPESQLFSALKQREDRAKKNAKKATPKDAFSTHFKTFESAYRQLAKKADSGQRTALAQRLRQMADDIEKG